MIALALLIVVIAGAVQANMAAQYWSLASETSAEALYKAKTIIEEQRAVAAGDFQKASSSPLTASTDADSPADASCIAGGLCYLKRSTVVDISSCSKYVEAYVEWRLGLRYPTSTSALYTNLTNNEEVVALGGDCVLNVPEGDWTANPSEVVSEPLSPSYITGIDVLQKKIYLTSSTSPQFRVYDVPDEDGNISSLGSSSGYGMRLNSLDVVRDLATGRTYAFVAQHASTSQLAVVDTTDAANPSFVSKRSLSGVDQGGSYPEAWRVFAYNGRLYVTTRETAGPELHIFNINAPTQPSEIVSARTDVNRTVNDMVVREQKVGNTLHRYLFLAADSNLKEVSVYDVTGDSPAEVVAIDLPGTQDAMSIFLNGNRLYVGRVSGSEPELLVFDVEALLDGSTTTLATSEVGASVESIRGSGPYLFLGTSESGEQFQVWTTDTSEWSETTVNAGRLSYTSLPGLAPLGVELNTNWVYLVSQSDSTQEELTVMYAP